MPHDRDLLELAAKAAGYTEFMWVESYDDYYWYGPSWGLQIGGIDAPVWNPLEDDGDALRLAVKLEIDIDFVSHHAPGRLVVFTDGNWSEFCDPDPLAATRRAIVRAAAALAQEPQS